MTATTIEKRFMQVARTERNPLGAVLRAFADETAWLLSDELLTQGHHYGWMIRSGTGWFNDPCADNPGFGGLERAKDDN